MATNLFRMHNLISHKEMKEHTHTHTPLLPFSSTNPQYEGNDGGEIRVKGKGGGEDGRGREKRREEEQLTEVGNS